MLYDPIIKFLEGSEKDFQGRLIKDIWDYSDQEIENIHDFIQVLFPLGSTKQKQQQQILY